MMVILGKPSHPSYGWDNKVYTGLEWLNEQKLTTIDHQFILTVSN